MSTVLTNDEAKKHLAENLRRLLDEHDISQASLAREIGVSSMAVTHYLAGRQMVGAGPLARMAEVFGVSTDFLLAKPRQKKSQKSA